MNLTTMSNGKNVLIIGPGFIGWNVLDILAKEGYNVSGLVRRKEHGDGIKASGATNVVIGDLNDTKLITEQTTQHDIIFHTATADHLPSVQAVFGGLRERLKQGKETIFIHTSGTSVLEDTSMVSKMHCPLMHLARSALVDFAQGAYKGDKIYRDDRPEEIDVVPDTALHRQIDLAITNAQRELASTGKAKIAIMIPPTIFGCESPDLDSLLSC